MQRFSVIGTAHVPDPRLLRALKVALDEAAPDQVILEMTDLVATRGDLESQKPEMVFAHEWASAHGVPVRGHEPEGPSILRNGVSPERIAELAHDMDALVRDLTPRRTIDVFCRSGPAETPAEERLGAIVEELIDPDKAAARTEAIIDNIRRLSVREGSIVILCGGAHAQRIAIALPGCRIVRGDHFF